MHRFKKTTSFSIAGHSSDAIYRSLLADFFHLTPGSDAGVLSLESGEIPLEVVSHMSGVLSLKSVAPSSDVHTLNLSLCVCDVCLGNSSTNNSAVATIEMVVLGSSSHAAEDLMNAIAKKATSVLPSKSTCFTDARADTPVSVMNKS